MIALDRPTAAFGTQARGFTLLEVMVALLITSIGLLGIAKVHALAYASTATAGMRSLVALQAGGTGIEHACQSQLLGRRFGTRPHNNHGRPAPHQRCRPLMERSATPVYCVSGIGPAPCTPDSMAAFDLHTYAVALNGALANSNPITTINCPVAVPVNCTIQVTWDEKAVSINKQSVAGTTQPHLRRPTYCTWNLSHGCTVSKHPRAAA